MACRYYNARSLSDRLTAFRGLEGTPAYNRTLSHFYAAYGSKPMAMYKWFRAQAGSDQPGNTENVRALMRHPAFDARDGWTCSAVLSGFADSVPNFHAADGSGYRFLADAILEVRQEMAQHRMMRLLCINFDNAAVQQCA
jgi:aminopeptidase N